MINIIFMSFDLIVINNFQRVENFTSNEKRIGCEKSILFSYKTNEIYCL